MIVEDKLAKNEYYHGTIGWKAIQILYEGFRLKKQYSSWGIFGTFKQGIYLTKSLETASCFTPGIIFKCRLSGGISLLRIDGKYDSKIIGYLKREFGKDILTNDISKSIPRNKHLTRKELINLLNYRYCNMGNFKGKTWKWLAIVSSIRQQLRLHKYDAIGETDDHDGVAVFNPYFVKPLEIYHVRNVRGKHYLTTFDKQKFASKLKQDISELREYGDSPQEQDSYNYLDSLLERYCKDNMLSQ